MTQLYLKHWIKPLVALVLLIFITSCNQSEYDRIVRDEMAKGLELNELKFGLAFKDSKSTFFEKCKELNRKQLTMQGPENNYVQHMLNDTAKAPIRYLFYGTFDKNNIMDGLKMKFSYMGWAPWTEHLQNDRLLEVVMDTLQGWYPGNDFKVIENEKLDYPLYYKIDGNRQILLHLEGTRDVIGLITDLNQKQS